VLFQAADKRILLFYKEGATIPQWRTMVMSSGDGGHSFSPARELVPGDVGGRGPVKNKPVLLQNGGIAAPASLEGEIWDSFVDLSHDNGETWQKSGMIPVRRTGYQVPDLLYDPRHCFGKGLIQPTLWESAPGSLHALMRSTSSAIFRSDSTDGGKSWCCAYDTGLPNNNSGIDLVKLPSGGLVLAWNPVGNLPNYYKGPRTPLVISYSGDNGETWDQVFTLEDTQGSYAYPAIVADDTHLYLTYTWHREQIVYWKLSYCL
jgi:predicted neuraminidase